MDIKTNFTKFMCCFSALCVSLCVTLPWCLTSSVDAEAADISLPSVTLTVMQTLALYGTDFMGTVWDSTNNVRRGISYHYIGTADAYIPRTSGVHNMFLSTSNWWFNNTADLPPELTSPSAPVLVYRCNTADAWSNEGDYNAIHNIDVPLSVSIPDTFGFVENIYYGSRANRNLGGSSMSHIDFGGNNLASSVRSWFNPNNSTVGVAWTPLSAVDDASNVDPKYMVACVPCSFSTYDNPFDITSIQFHLNYCYWVSDFSVDEVSHWCHYLFIECPTIQGYQPPSETTTSPSATFTTAPYETNPPVDLSGIESGVGTMIDEQWRSNYYLQIQIDQLNTIIQQLNSIYAKMAEQGQVPVSLDDADSYPLLNSSIRSSIGNSVSSYTMAQLPSESFGNGAQGLTSFMFFLDSGPWLSIGLFCIGFAIFTWFIFRGRTS